MATKRAVLFAINVLLCIQYLLARTEAQVTTASPPPVTRPLDIDDDEISGDGSTTVQSTTLEDTTAALATTPLSEIDVDDEETTQSSVTTPQTRSETTRPTVTPSTTVPNSAAADQSSVWQIGDTTAATAASAPIQTTTPNTMTACNEDRDCSSNQHCVTRNSSSQCHCKPGYSVADNGLCIEKIKHFGGKMHFETDNTIPVQRYEEITERLINSAFAMRLWFRDINILASMDDSATISYEVITDDDANVNAQLIEDILEEFMETDATFEDVCACEQEQCNVENVVLLATDTCRDTGQPNQVLCQQSVDISQYCDATSTICTASDDGRISCPCREDYVFNTVNSCIRQVCANDADCNHGTCDDAAIGGMCVCQWGFDGSHCDNPWLLVVTVLLAVTVVVALALITYLVMRKMMKRRSAKIADMQEALSREPKYGYRKKNENYNISPWHSGPVTPKSFNQVESATARMSFVPAAIGMSPAHSTSVITRSDPVIHPAASNNVDVQVNMTPASVERGPARLGPPESEVLNIRNLAQKKLSSRRQASATNPDIDFVLPNQALDL